MVRVYACTVMAIATIDTGHAAARGMVHACMATSFLQPVIEQELAGEN